MPGELDTLRAIQQASDSLIVVQDFFDLIVEAGTGRLTAIVLAREDWSSDRCRDFSLQ